MTGVEVNPIIVADLMLGKYWEYSGRTYSRPGIRIETMDARSYLERSNEQFEVIQANAVDTWAAAGGGGFTLSESYLYTLEAFDLYFKHLREDGVLTFGRWVFDPPQQMLRVLALALESMANAGIEHPQAEPARPLTLDGRARHR